MSTLYIFSAQYLYLLEIILFILYFISLSNDKKKSLLLFSLVYFPFVFVVSKVFALLYFDPRPFVVGHFIPLISHVADNGFPSDHILLTGAIASVLLVYNKKFGIVAWIITVLVGISRVFAGVHHWIDIVGSMVIVIIVSQVYSFFLDMIPKKRHKNVISE